MLVHENEAGHIVRDCAAEYAISVATNRVVPNLMDGLKPVFRRLLLTADDMGLASNKKTVKTARLIGTTMANYHPHGDACPNNILMPFSCRYPLLTGVGNWGSPDTPWPAAPRYTELKLSPFAEHVYLSGRKYAKSQPNYDGTREEVISFVPVIPGCLVMGAVGLGYGLQTSIPSHNATDVCYSLLDYLNGKDYMWLHPDTCEAANITSSKTAVRQLYMSGKATINYHGICHWEKEGRNHKLVIESYGPGFQKSKLLKLKWLMDAVDSGRLWMTNESKKEIRYVYWSKDRSLLEALERQITSKESYRMIIEHQGAVHLYNLTEIYETFTEGRCEYIRGRYQSLLSDVNSEIAYNEVLQYLQSHPEYVRAMMDKEESEVVAELESMGYQTDAINRALRQSIRTLLKSSHDRLQETYERLLKERSEYEEYINKPRSKMITDIRDMIEYLKKYNDHNNVTWGV